MNSDSARRPWTGPVIVTLAFVLPGVVPGIAMPGGAGAGAAAAWLGSGASQALSQFALLIVIIGASGRLRDYGVSGMRPADALKAALLLVLVVLASRTASSAAVLVLPGAGSAGPVLPSPGGTSRAAIVALSALFALAVGYREELFYRLYVITSLRDRGAGAASAIAVSTLLFAAGHAYQGAPGILSALLVGTVMAAAAVRGYGLHALALAHAAYDFGVLMTAFGMVSGST